MQIANKRGQDLSITTLVLIVLGIIVLIFIIIGFTLGWGYIFDKINILPGQSLETAAQSCKISAQNNLLIDYCKQFKEVKINGETQYINCEHPDILVSLNAAGVSLLDCKDYATAKKDECASLVLGGKKISTKVNGEACSGLIGACSDLSGGVDKGANPVCASDKKELSIGTIKCCVPK